MTTPLNQVPHKSIHFKPLSTENKAENQGSSLKYKFKWKDQEYTLSWENPQGVISDKDKNQYIDKQIDKILLLIERHLYVNNKSLKCSLDLQQVDVIKKKSNGSETNKRIPSPFDFNSEVKALNDKKKHAATLEKAKRQSLEDKLKHAEEAANMQKSLADNTKAKTSQNSNLDKLGHLKIEKTDEKKIKVSYGPIGYTVKLIVGLGKFLIKNISTLKVFQFLKDKFTQLFTSAKKT